MSFGGGGLSSLGQIYICAAGASLNRDDPCSEEAWDGSTEHQKHLYGEDLASLARESFRSAMWFNDLIGTHSFLISKKNWRQFLGASGEQDSSGLSLHRT